MIKKMLNKLFDNNSGEKQSTVATPHKLRELTFNPDTIVSDAIEEALLQGGLLKLSAKDNIENIISECMSKGFKAVATEYRKQGEQLTKIEKKELKIRANAFMSKQAASELTEKGKQKPLEAHFLTLWRADFTIYRARHILAASQHDFGRLEQLGVHRDDCENCRRTLHEFFDPSKTSPFPPPECPHASCMMMFHSSIDWIAERKSKR